LFSLENIHIQFQKFSTIDELWWRGLARILEVKGYIREGDDKVYLITLPRNNLSLQFLYIKMLYIYNCKICPTNDVCIPLSSDSSRRKFREIHINKYNSWKALFIEVFKI